MNSLRFMASGSRVTPVSSDGSASGRGFGYDGSDYGFSGLETMVVD